jgi:hypothetical protein
LTCALANELINNEKANRIKNLLKIKDIAFLITKTV